MMRIRKIVPFIILSFFIILKAEEPDRIAIFPFKTDGIETDSSFIFVDSLRNEVRKSKQYMVMEYSAMEKSLALRAYKGDILCYDVECAFVMGEFLSAKRIVQGMLKKKRNTFSINIRFLDLEKEDIILDVTEHFKGTFEELLTNKIPKFAEMINWSTKYLNSVNKSKKILTLRNSNLDRKSRLRILFGITSLATLGSGVVMNYLAEKKVEEYQNVAEEYKISRSNDQYAFLNKRYEDAYKSADQRIKARNVLFSLAGTGAACFSITFFF